MYKKIVVPLDGSKLAECILPHVEELAKGCGTEEIVLVSVTERLKGRTRSPDIRERGYITDKGEFPAEAFSGLAFENTDDLPILLGKKAKQANRYLHKIEKQLKVKGVKVNTQVLLGNPAEKIASFAEEIGASLITMASHGRSGPSRWAHGSVTDKVLRAGCVPILIIRAPGCVAGI
jgi:nucleotide-binding universal stress UspA family protein